MNGNSLLLQNCGCCSITCEEINAKPTVSASAGPTICACAFGNQISGSLPSSIVLTNMGSGNFQGCGSPGSMDYTDYSMDDCSGTPAGTDTITVWAQFGCSDSEHAQLTIYGGLDGGVPGNGCNSPDFVFFNGIGPIGAIPNALLLTDCFSTMVGLSLAAGYGGTGSAE